MVVLRRLGTAVVATLAACAAGAGAHAISFSSARLAAQAQPERHGRPCRKLFTVRMGTRAAGAVYAGRRDVSASERRMLARIARCQRNPRATGYVLSRVLAARRAWEQRRSCVPQLASWYADGGATASGFHAYYGVANKALAFGTLVRLSYGGRTVAAVVDDRGPYVGGRVWDLNQNTAAALGFGGVGVVCASPAG